MGDFVQKEINRIAGHVCVCGGGNVGEEQQNYVKISAAIHSQSIYDKSVS